ncbi:MAG: hypothetical protein QOJ02_913 [Acidobacteriota bacterium]|jgi:hypothetical protein|nr:hypothetical protein [Acidobacteriota bacterium]
MINSDFNLSDNSLSQREDKLLRLEIERWAVATTRAQGDREARLLEKVEAVTGFFSVANKSPQDIRPPDVRIWCDMLEAGGRNASTIRDYVGFLSSFFVWLIKASIPELPLSQNPTKVVRRQPLEAASTDNLRARMEALIGRARSVHFGNNLDLRNFSTDDIDELEELIRYQRSQLASFTDPADIAAGEKVIVTLREFGSPLKKLRIMYLICAMRAVSEINRKRGELVNWDTVIEELRSARPSWEIPANENFTIQWLDKLDALLIDSLNQRLTHVPRTRLASATIAREGFLRFPSERIFKATIEALMPGSLLTGASLHAGLERYSDQAKQINDRFRATYIFKSDKGDFEGAIGFPHDTNNARLQIVQDMPSLAVKAVFALWARLYAEVGDPVYGQPISISVSQFCNDLGYKRKDNSHEPENRRQAILILKAILELEATITYKPNERGMQMQGSVFQQCPLALDIKGYSDVFVSSGLAEQESFKGAGAFSYGPGKVYQNPIWHARNRSVALVGKGLLTLGNGNKDKWAVLVGGYLASFVRMNRYQQQMLDTKALLEKTGLSGEKERHRQLGRMHNKLESALDRLQEVSFIKSWKPIMSDSAQWLSEKIEICWPDALSKRAREKGAERTKRSALRKQRINQLEK